MVAAHIHLLVVHVPVLFCPLAWVILAIDAWRGTERPALAYGLLMVSGVSAIAAYYSGPGAYEQLQASLATEKSWVEQHAVLGRAAFVVMVLVGVLALQALLRILQDEPRSKGLRVAILIGAFIGSYLLAWTAHLGGQIRHVEIRHADWTLFPDLPD